MKKPGIYKRPGNQLSRKWRCYFFSASRSNHHALLSFICAGSQVR